MHSAYLGTIMNSIAHRVDGYSPNHFCPICYDLKGLVYLDNHGHLSCEDCLRDYVAFYISNKGSSLLCCPFKDCRTKLSPELTVKYCPTELLAKYHRYSDRDKLMTNPFVKFCPVPDCEGYGLSNSSRNLTCDVCAYKYCAYCLEPWHRSICKNFLDEKLDRWAYWSNAKHCPTCGLRIEKNGGCPHMTCSQCGTGFCWHCGLKDSEHGSCVFLSDQLRNPDWIYIFGMILSPVTFLLTFVIYFLFAASVSRDGLPYSLLDRLSLFMYRHRVLSSTLILLITPLIWVLLPFVWLACLFDSQLDTFLRKCFRKRTVGFWEMVGVSLLAIQLTIAVYPFVVVFILCTAALAIPVGLLYALWKAVISIMRTNHPGFLKRRIRLGF
jgi:hypothetical protein